MHDKGNRHPHPAPPDFKLPKADAYGDAAYGDAAQGKRDKTVKTPIEVAYRKLRDLAEGRASRENVELGVTSIAKDVRQAAIYDAQRELAYNATLRENHELIEQIEEMLKIARGFDADVIRMKKRLLLGCLAAYAAGVVLTIVLQML